MFNIWDYEDYLVLISEPGRAKGYYIKKGTPKAKAEEIMRLNTEYYKVYGEKLIQGKE